MRAEAAHAHVHTRAASAPAPFSCSFDVNGKHHPHRILLGRSGPALQSLALTDVPTCFFLLMLTVNNSNKLANHLRRCNKGATADIARVGSVVAKSG